MWIFVLSFIFVSLWVLFGVLYFIVYNNGIKRHFESKGIPYMGNGTILLFLNALRGIGNIENFANQYNVMKEKKIKMGGTIDSGIRTLIVADTKLIKTILVKDFDHFTDRRGFGFAKNESILTRMLFLLRGDQWRELRTKLSPTFTTGKIKRMFRLFDQSGKKLVKFFESEIEGSNGEIELSKGFSKFAMDIIASAVCGFESKAFHQKEPSLFELMGKSLQFNFGGLQLIKFLLMNVLPTKVSDFFGFAIIGRETEAFFSNVIKSSIHQEVSNGERRDDFIQLMKEAREGKLKTEESELESFEKDAILKTIGGEAGGIKPNELLDDDSIVANCVLFIVAGFDTTQSLLLLSAYALALNQDIQQRLRTEVDQVLEEYNGELTYDGLAKMTYLDMVINGSKKWIKFLHHHIRQDGQKQVKSKETLRFWPPFPAASRSCTIEYKVPGVEIVLEKGDGVFIPVYGMHHDEQFFPNPEKFDPERFSPENKSKINPYAFLPFGQGPRNCIGMRFALTEAKVVISQLVHNFQIEPSSKTLIPMKFAKSVTIKPEGGLFVTLQKI